MLAEIREREGVIVIRPTGRMIGAANAEIREQINEELEEHFDSPKVIFNLESVTRMDSSGLGTLVSVSVTVSRKGGRTALVNAGSHILNLLILDFCEQHIRCGNNPIWNKGVGHALNSFRPLGGECLLCK